jgi:SNF2 family DNA or RNA helicase
VTFSPSEPQRILAAHMLNNSATAGFVGMGIGKTATTLYALNELLHDLAVRAALVVAPLRVVNLTWPNEVEKWEQFRWMRVANLRTEEGKQAFMAGTAQLYLINYEQLATVKTTIHRTREPTKAELAQLRDGLVPPTARTRKDFKLSPDVLQIMLRGEIPKGMRFTRPEEVVHLGFIDEFCRKRKQLPFDLVVIDEITKCKSHSASGPKALWSELQRRGNQITKRWGLTGTPAPNSLMDLFAQIRLLDDGAALGTSFTRFQQMYFDSDYMGWKWTPKPWAKDAINKAIAHLTVTLSSEDWLDIPDVHIEDVEVSLPDPASYRQFERDLLIEVEGQTVTAANAAVLLGKLQQFTSGALYMEDKSTVHLHDAKLDALAAIVKKTDGPVLVAVNFQSEQDRLRARFPKAKFFADAKTAAEQQALLAAWNAGKVPMLVAHPASVGHGLNLQHGGNTLVWMTLTFSRENYEQMIARLARRGQENVTTVYRLGCPGTVDDVVVEALREKKETERSLLDSLKLLEKAAAQRS